MGLKSYQFSQGVASWLLDSERPLRISILVRILVASVCLILTPDEVGLVWDPHQNVHCRNRSTNDYHQFWLHVWWRRIWGSLWSFVWAGWVKGLRQEYVSLSQNCMIFWKKWSSSSVCGITPISSLFQVMAKIAACLYRARLVGSELARAAFNSCAKTRKSWMLSFASLDRGGWTLLDAIELAFVIEQGNGSVKSRRLLWNEVEW